MMVLNRTWLTRALIALIACGLVSSCGLRRKKYENPITKDTQQPDKVLFDKAIKDIERGRYEVARLTLNTLINTYDTSEYLAKAKLAVADSWYREGGAHGLAQAEAEYKDFILFYPTMEEAAESQYRICDIHYKQMEKPDRDQTQALRAEAECRQLLTQFPNSKFAPLAEQRMRDIQEVLAESEMRVGQFYNHKGSNPAAANRLNALVDQYPLYSGADEALWLEADSYSKMGTRFRAKAGEAYTRIVRDYPLSNYVEPAKKKLKEMELPIPEPDPVAYNRMKYELENRKTPGLLSRSFGIFRSRPDVSMAAKSGTPAMTPPRPTIPASVPAPAASSGFTGDVTVSTPTDTTALDTKPDARQVLPGQQQQSNQPAAASNEPLPTNQTYKPKKQKKSKKQKQTEQAPAQTSTTAPVASGVAQGAPNSESAKP